MCYKLIADAIVWLDKNEPSWELEEPIDKEEFLLDLLARAGVKKIWTEGELKHVVDQEAKCYGILKEDL